MVQRIHRAIYQQRITLRVNIVAYAEEHLMHVLHVHVLIHDDDELRKHHQHHAPDARHHLLRLAGIALANRDDDDVMESALDRHVDIDDLWQHDPQQVQEEALRRLAQIGVFHRWLADDGGRINRITARSDSGDMHHWIGLDGRVVAGVVAKRPPRAQLIGIDVALQHDLGLGGYLHIHRLALHHLDTLV